jgi:ribosomal protein L11 methyltransferase
VKPAAGELETVSLDGLPEAAVPAFEAALAAACEAVGYFHDADTDTWRVEGLRRRGADDGALLTSLALAGMATGIAAAARRAPVEAEGWLARTLEGFPEQPIGRRFLVRPTHLPDAATYGRIVLRLDAGLAFGSGEHASTRGCLLALEGLLPRRRPARVLDLGTGSGILAIAAARAWRVPVLATDIEPWSVRVAGQNAALNGVARLVSPLLADGWRHRALRRGGFDLVFANILTRPLSAMARRLAAGLAPGGVAILAGLLGVQARQVLAAHRRCGLVLVRRLDVGAWTTLVLRNRTVRKRTA